VISSVKVDPTDPINSLRKDKLPIFRVRFKILKSWKGQNKGEIDVYTSGYCACPPRNFPFSTSEEYLIDTDSKNFADTCNEFSLIKPFDMSGENKFTYQVERLNSFWFRTWARIYPF